MPKIRIRLVFCVIFKMPPNLIGSQYEKLISTVADSIVIDEASSHDDLVTITEITGWQIVNGGQTTASIYNAFQAKLPLEKVHVQIKLNLLITKIQQSKS